MQPCEWRSDTGLSSSNYVQQHPSTSFCIDNILGKPTVTAAQRSQVAPVQQYNMEQPRFHDNYRTPSYPMVFPPRTYGNPFMAYQRHHPYAMPAMGYNIQAPIIPSIYDAFQDPMGKHWTLRILSLVSFINLASFMQFYCIKLIQIIQWNRKQWNLNGKAVGLLLMVAKLTFHKITHSILFHSCFLIQIWLFVSAYI